MTTQTLPPGVTLDLIWTIGLRMGWGSDCDKVRSEIVALGLYTGEQFDRAIEAIGNEVYPIG